MENTDAPLLFDSGTGMDLPGPGQYTGGYESGPLNAPGNVGTASGDGWNAVWQQLAVKGLSAAIDNQFVQPFQLAHDKALATDPYGNLYLRGTPTGGIAKPIPAPGSSAAQLQTLMPWLLGGLVVAGLVFALR